MGVKRLLTYIKSNEIFQKVELSILAGKVFNETGKKPKLLCDFFNLMEWFWRPPVQALVKSQDYPEYTSMYGGDFHLFADRIRCFVAALEFIGIEPIFFVDGPRGSDESFKGKIPLLKQRDESRLQSVEIMQQVCKGSLPTYPDMHCQHSTIIRQLVVALQKTDAKLVFCCGEADPEIIGYAQSHEETCGVLSSDSDFAITSGSIMFPVECFDVEGTLKLNGVLLDNSPVEIVCKAVCPRDVATHLGIRENQLPDLAALCGNDYTRDILNRLSVLTKLGVEGSDIDSVAVWLRDKETVLLDYEPMRDLCIEYPELRLAMEQSYSNYTVGRPSTSCDLEVSYATHLYPVVERETINGTGVRSFLSVAKHGIHWRSLCYESITLGDPCFSDTLLSVRKSMYVLLGVREVTEYGRTQRHTFDQLVVPVCVSPSEVDVGIRCFHALRELHAEAKLVGLYQFMTRAVHVTCTRDVEEIVEEIIGSSHELPDLAWPKLYQVVMIVTCLKVIAILNRVSQPPLNLSDSELDALLLSCLTCSTNGEIPPHMTGVKPSMRTISIGEWFSTVTTCCYGLACLLRLLEAQPEPRNIFYPMVFAPYHIALEAKPDLEDKDKVGTDYIRNAMQTALGLPALKAVRSEIFDANQIQPLSQLVDRFLAAQRTMEANQRQLFPRVTTPDSELLLSDSEDQMSAGLDSEIASASSSGDETKGHFTVATDPSTHESDANSGGMLPGTSAERSECDSDVKKLRALQMRSQTPAVDQKATVVAPTMGLSEKHNILKESVWHDTSELPIMEHRDKILDLVARNQVVCIEGETGCGKSSQVPQFILEEAFMSVPPQRVRVLINQPNFIAAMKLAECVAEERRESLGVTVGYCSEVERYPKDGETTLTFCTTGYMLQVLQGLQTTSDYTHIILDEIHQRSTDIDFTMLVVRRLALSYPKVKVILMSATLQGDLFIDYFREKLGINQVASPVFVGIKRFPVKEFCVDELDKLMARKEDEVQDDAMRDLQLQLKKFTEDPSVLPLRRADICPFAQQVCINLIISQCKPGDTILVFLSGSSDISDFHSMFHKRLKTLRILARFKIFLFHNQVAREDQKGAFQRPVRGTANVILANRSAESSLTFPDLKLVLNFGVSMVPVYNTMEHITRLTRRWCSRASCIQRAGRVGRVSEGTVVHLFPREFYEKLPDFNPPEIVDAPLAKTLLKAKEICCKLDIPLPSILLGSVVQSPSLLQFEAALHDLVDSGALHHNPLDEISERADITLLGRFSTSLPLDLNLCRLVLLGILFGCPLDAIVFATAMSMYQDVFTLPTTQVMNDTYQFCSSLARSTFSRMKFDDRSFSNPIMMRNMFIEWLKFKYMNRNQHSSRRELANGFCGKYAVRVGRLLHFETYVRDIARSVMEYIPSSSILHSELQNLARIEHSNDGEPRYCDNNFFTEHGTSKSLQRPMCGKYVPPALQRLRTLSTSKSSSLHFCSNYTVLKALIAAAAGDSSKFMCGERACESHDPKIRSMARRSLNMMQAEQFPTDRSLAMDLAECDNIEEENATADQEGIESFFRSLPDGYCFPVTISADENTAIVHFWPCNYVSTSNSVNEIALKIDPSLSRLSSVDHDPAGSPSGAISILPLETEFFWRFGERRNSNWEVGDVSCNLPVPFHPCSLNWHELTESRLHVNTVFMNWRNPTAQMCVLEGPSGPYFAVASKVLSTSRMYSRYATSVTLLPSMPEGLFILLAFQPTASAVEMLVDTELNLVKDIKFNSLQIPCANIEVYITPNRLNAINKLRRAISTAATIPLSDGCIPLSDSVIQKIPELLQNVLSTDCSSSTGLHTQTRSLARAPTYSPDLVWEMVTPGGLPTNAHPESSPSSHYYPEFRCSLLGTEPYSVKEVQLYGNVFSGMYSVEYTHSAAAKILAKQARMQAAEREGSPVQTEPLEELIDSTVEQGDQKIARGGNSKELRASEQELQSFSTTVTPSVQPQTKEDSTIQPMPTQNLKPEAVQQKRGASKREAGPASKPAHTAVVVKRPNTTEEETTSETHQEQAHEGAEQGHLDSVSSEDATMTHSSASTATVETTEVCDGGTVSPHTVETLYGTRKEQLNTKVGQGCFDPAFCRDIPITCTTAFTATQTAQELCSGSRTLVQPNASDNTSEKTLSEAVREQTCSKTDQGSSNTAVSQGACVDGRINSSRAPTREGTSTPVTTAMVPGIGSSESHMSRTSKTKTSEMQPEALRKDIPNQCHMQFHASVSHDFKKPEAEVHCGVKSNESVTSERDGNAKQKSEVPASATTSNPQKLKKASTGGHAASNGAAKNEEVMGQLVAPERDLSLQPGTDEHLAEFLVGVIRSQGGVTRLAYLRKKAYPQYYCQYRKYGADPYLKKELLMKHPELFEVYEEDSGMVFVRLFGAHGGNSKELRASEQELQSFSTTVTPSVQPQTKEDATIQAMPTQNLKPKAVQQKRGASKREAGPASKSAHTAVVVKRPNTTEEETTSETHQDQAHGWAEQGHLVSVSSEDATMTHSSTSTATVQTTEVCDGGTLSTHTDDTGRPSACSKEKNKTQYGTSMEQLHTPVGQGCSSRAPTREIKPSTSTPVMVAMVPGIGIADSHIPRMSANKISEVQPEALRKAGPNQGHSSASVSHDYNKPQVEIHCPMKPKEPITSERDGNAKQKKKKASTGGHAASNGAAKNEEVMDQMVAPERDSSLQPGTDEHLAEFLVGVIRSQGGVTRLSYLRKKAYPQYYYQYLNYGVNPYFKKELLMKHPQLFQVYKEDSGMVFVRLFGAHGGNSKELRASEQELQSFSTTVTPSVQPQTKEDATIQPCQLKT